MTVTTDDNKKFYTTDGVTAEWDFTFKYFIDADITVYLDGEVVNTDDYTVTASADGNGGTISFDTIPDDAQSLLIFREVDYLQSSKVPSVDKLSRGLLENLYDKLAMVNQQLKEITDRSFKVAFDQNISDLSTELTLVANKAIVINADATGITMSTDDYEDQLADVTAQAVAAAASATAAAASVAGIAANAALAVASAAAAATSASNALASQVAAAASATSATSSASTATTQAGIATAQAVVATAQAATATTQAGLAAASATSAAASATAAAVSAAAAAVSVTDSAASAVLASEWATTTGSLVQSSDYSAKEYAVGTTATSAKSWAQLTGGVVTGSSYSAKEHAVGTSVATGSAKDWASKTSAQVASTDYSAKEFATGTQASTGGSAKSWAQQTSADVTGAAANSRSAKSWAQDDLHGATLGGSSKDWAQSASSPDGVLESSKTYASNSSTSATAAAASATAAAASATAAAASAAGFSLRGPCKCSTTANLNATYANGASGVGATLINAGSLAAFTSDGISPSSGDRIAVVNQTTQLQNGIYTVTTVGSGVIAWVLTRATDYDQAADITEGTATLIEEGTAQGGYLYYMNQSAAITVGTTAITWHNLSIATGTVTSVATGTGLTGGTITSSGTIDLDFVNMTTATLASGDYFATVDVSNGNGEAKSLVSDLTTTLAASVATTITGTGTSTFLRPDDVAGLWEKGTDITSGSTITIPSSGGQYFHITGTTGITAISEVTSKTGRKVRLYFEGALTLTHNATSLILPTGANITTAIGDVFEFTQEDASNNYWRCTNHMLKSGKALVDNNVGTVTSVGTGTGLTGGAITTTGTINLDFVNLTTATLASGDYLTTVDVSNGNDEAKSLVSDLTTTLGASVATTITGTGTTTFLRPDDVAGLWEKGTDIASGGTITVPSTGGGYFHVTGTTTITAISEATTKAGRHFWLIFDGALTLTHNATSLILPTGANITTAAGDAALVVNDDGTNWRVAAYLKKSGKALANPTLVFTSTILTSGTTWTKAANNVGVLVETVSGGGGGGAADNSSTTNAAMGGGGGAGGYASVWVANASLGTTESYAIGAAGTAGDGTGAGGGNGGDGGTTSFGTSIFVQATGGKGGTGGDGASTAGANAGPRGGLGGLGSGSGALAATGAPGQPGGAYSASANAFGGMGGSSIWGGGGRGPIAPDAVGEVATGYGGGGAGGVDNDTTGSNGGAGTQGAIRILEVTLA